MPVLGIDLGGTKVCFATFTEPGELIKKETIALEGRGGAEAGKLITDKLAQILAEPGAHIRAIGTCVPGISWSSTGNVWAPNIPGWENYPLLAQLQAVSRGIPVAVDSDRACYILGEHWKGNAKGCKDAIFLAVGTGIGAGILVNGSILRGADDIAGAIGWMALDKPYREKYTSCGCFEYHASGEGIARVCREVLAGSKEYSGMLNQILPEKLKAADVFKAFEIGDPIALRVFQICIEFWGMAVANLVSLFNPEKIIFGGGVFGPGVQFLEGIRAEATRWAQPLAMSKVAIEISGMGGDAGVFGAGYLAMQELRKTNHDV